MTKKEVSDGLFNIMEETERLDNIVRNYEGLLESRKSMFVYGDINNVVREAVTLIERDAVDRGVKIIANLPDELLNINLRKNLLRIAVYHILSNAVEAMAGKGTITVSTYGKDNRIFLVIADEGRGFKKEYLDKVFDPFFSTKENSYGLGMPLVSHIIKEHMGEIEVKSEEGKGTVFKLLFPIRWIQ